MTSLREQQKAYAYIDELFMDKDFKIVNINELYIKLLLISALGIALSLADIRAWVKRRREED